MRNTRSRPSAGSQSISWRITLPLASCGKSHAACTAQPSATTPASVDSRLRASDGSRAASTLAMKGSATRRTRGIAIDSIERPSRRKPFDQPMNCCTVRMPSQVRTASRRRAARRCRGRGERSCMSMATTSAEKLEKVVSAAQEAGDQQQAPGRIELAACAWNTATATPTGSRRSGWTASVPQGIDAPRAEPEAEAPAASAPSEAPTQMAMTFNSMRRAERYFSDAHHHVGQDGHDAAGTP